MWERPETIACVLQLFVDHGGKLDARTLAQHLWPQSKLWNQPAKLANAAGHREFGVRLHTAAGCLCGRLARRGLVRRIAPKLYEITDAGRRFLQPPATPPAASAPPPPVASPWRPCWVLWPDGQWYQGSVGPPYGTGYVVAMPDGRQFVAPPASVRPW